MKRCVKCGNRRRTQIRHHDRIRIADGITVDATYRAEKCAVCGEIYVAGRILEKIELEAAAVLAENGICTGDTFRFMRKALGLRADELAAMLDVAPETISRWENGHRPLDRAGWMTLASMVSDRKEGRSTTLDRLEATKGPHPRRPLRLAVA